MPDASPNGPRLLSPSQVDPTLPGLLDTIVPGAEGAVSEHTMRPPLPDSTGPIASLSGLASRIEEEVDRGAVLGEGGMGVVHLGRQRVLEREVAIKSISPHARPESARRAILLEAWAASTLEHPHIVPVHTLATDEEGNPHLVMRRIAGRTWSVYMANPELVRQEFGVRDPLAWHLSVLMAVCNAVSYAHSRGILHRDLKPDNVMVGRFGEVWVLDWGLAVRLREDGPSRLPLASDDRRVVGTPRYMSPEMARGAGHELSERTDVYLIGGILYAILTGQGPHPGREVEETLARIPDFRPHLPPGTPTRLGAIARRALAAEPKDRFASVEELRLALLTFQEERAAETLVERSMFDLDRLVQLLSQGEVDRTAAHRLFGACRFGFMQALEAVPGHPSAAEGLRRALIAMASYELSRGDAGGASVYLAEVDDPPLDLLSQRDALLDEQQRERDEAQALRASVDSRIGRRTRSFVFGLMAVAWTALPLVTWLQGQHFSYPRLLAVHGPMFLLSLGLVLWGRKSMERTSLNRTVSRALVVTQAQILATVLVGARLEMSADQVTVMYHLILCASSLLLMGIYGWRSLVCSVAFALAAGGGAIWPELLAPLSTLSHAIVLGLVVEQARRRATLGVG